MKDITERKRTQEALRQSHDELRTLYDGAVDGLTVFDIGNCETVRVNAAMCDRYSESLRVASTQTVGVH
jgi:PAS domain-containing protein